MAQFPVLVAGHSQARYFDQFLKLPNITVVFFPGLVLLEDECWWVTVYNITVTGTSGDVVGTNMKYYNLKKRL
jgi:hypothetical protein